MYLDNKYSVILQCECDRFLIVIFELVVVVVRCVIAKELFYPQM